LVERLKKFPQREVDAYPIPNGVLLFPSVLGCCELKVPAGEVEKTAGPTSFAFRLANPRGPSHGSQKRLLGLAECFSWFPTVF